MRDECILDKKIYYHSKNENKENKVDEYINSKIKLQDLKKEAKSLKILNKSFGKTLTMRTTH